MSTVVVPILVIVWTELRIAELLWSEHDVPALLARGAREQCHGQHIWLLMANAVPPAAALLGVWVTRTSPTMSAAQWVMLALLVVAESVHWWAIVTLGRRWTTSVYVLPDEQPVRRGPYRFLRHPGYVAGASSAVLLPAVAGAWWGCAVVAVVMVAIVTARIRCEDAAWREAAAAVSGG